MSLQIQALERELKVRLLDRGSRKVALTAVGALFLVEARATLAQAERAIAVVRRAGEGRDRRDPARLHRLLALHRGHAPGDLCVPPALPGGASEAGGHDHARPVAALVARKLDLAFIRSPFAPIPPEVEALNVMTDRLMLVLRADHPLAALATVPIAALAHEPFVMFERDAGTGIWDQIVAICADRGFSPTVAQEAARRRP